jgi:cell volume regulation protein A
MNLVEPLAIPVLLTSIALLMLASVLLSRPSNRIGVPVVLLFLAIGVIVGRAGGGELLLENYKSASAFGTVALLLILFDGGLNTPLGRVNEGIRPAAALATIGVLGTAGVVALCARLFDFSWTEALLLGAIVSPTDAAAVFSILRGSGLQLKKRIAVVLELESGLNDPIAVLLTIALTNSLATHVAVTSGELLHIPAMLLGGLVGGAAVGYGGRVLLPRAHLPAGGLYPVLTLALAFLAFGLPALVHGSGFLSVYVASLIMGNGPMPYRGGIIRVHDSIAWLCQIVMYLLLGLLAQPAQLQHTAPVGIALGLFVTFVARPVVVALVLLPFRFQMREVIYLGWLGLRGAVPIILATYPVIARVSRAEEMFNVVFFVVIISTLVPGATARWITAKSRLKAQEPVPPPALLEIISTRLLRGGEILAFTIESSAAVCGAPIAELPLPPGSAVILLIRGEELIAPRGHTVLLPGDHTYLLCKPEDLALVRLIFGAAEQIE